jgi:pSer/pThr/pTyr-binding forkhead associated (FHA) protein
MEKLIVLSEDGVSQEFPLTEQHVSIGRDEQNVICLGDKSVSRHHATVQRVFRGFIIQDEGSTNGTRVNGRPITKQFLKHSDLIEIGKYHLRFLASPQGQSEDADKTIILQRTPQPEPAPVPQRPAPAQTPVAKPTAQQAAKIETAPPAEKPSGEETLVEQPSAVDQTQPDQAEEANAIIRFMAGERQGEEVAVDRAFFSVGNPGGDLVLVNKRHNGYFLLKVGGDAPPKLNGKPIKAGGVKLNNGDRIELGELSLEFND